MKTESRTLFDKRLTALVLNKLESENITKCSFKNFVGVNTTWINKFWEAGFTKILKRHHEKILLFLEQKHKERIYPPPVAKAGRKRKEQEQSLPTNLSPDQKRWLPRIGAEKGKAY